MTARPFLITGCGRSGTTWAARLFTMLGHECLHERQYRPTRHGPLDRSESSWLAIPYLAQLPPGTPIVRIVRDPYAVVQSVMARGFLRDMTRPHDAYAARHNYLVNTQTTQLGRAIAYAATWDLPIEDHHYTRLSGDDTPRYIAAVVSQATGATVTPRQAEDACRQLGTTINTNPDALKRHNRVPSITDINTHPLGPLLHARAEKLGHPTRPH